MDLVPERHPTIYLPEIGPLGIATRVARSAQPEETLTVPDRPAELTEIISSAEILTGIKNEIEEKGPMTHARFMELSLNGPGGYYASGKAKINGAGADFSTAASRSEFGGKLADGYYKQWVAMGKPAVVKVIEQGGGMGKMAKDTLAYARNIRPDFYEAMQYSIVDFAGMHPRQYDTIAGVGLEPSADYGPTYAEISTPRQHAADLNRMSWIAGSALTTKIGPLEDAIITSNELPDTFPADVVHVQQGEMVQRYVNLDSNGDLAEEWGPVTDEVQDYLETYGVQVGEGEFKAITPKAAEWQQHILAQFKPGAKGGIVTIDYAAQTPHKTLSGTVRYYPGSGHLITPGDIDITTDVDFDVLKHIAQSEGWDVPFYGDQDDYLLAVSDEERAEMKANQYIRPTLEAARKRQQNGILEQTFRALVLTQSVELDLTI